MKNTFRILAIAISCAALLLAAGCKKKEPQTAIVNLPSNPTSGYSWKVEQSNEIFGITQEYTSAQEGDIVGAGGYDTFTLTPKADGDVSVMFLYGRSWEEEPESKLVYNLKVDKNMQIKEESFIGSLPGGLEKLPDIPQLEIK